MLFGDERHMSLPRSGLAFGLKYFVRSSVPTSLAVPAGAPLFAAVV